MCSNRTGFEDELSAKELGRHLRKLVPPQGISRGPTFFLYLVLIGLTGVFTAAYWAGLIGVILTWSVLVPGYFFIAICVHDAVHRSAHPHPIFNELLGWTGAALHGLNYASLRRQHMHHHSHLGQDSDDERYVYHSAWTLPVRLFTVHLFCYASLWRAPRREKWLGIGFLACYGLGLGFFPTELLWGWCLPMLLSNAIFAWVSVYLPHGPLGHWVHRHVPLLTGYHQEHHALPQLPWYQIGSLARQRRRLQGFSRDSAQAM